MKSCRRFSDISFHKKTCGNLKRILNSQQKLKLEGRKKVFDQKTCVKQEGNSLGKLSKKLQHKKGIE